MPVLVVIRGGGDIASGIALRVHRAGLRTLITELPEPLVVRRTVSFAEAVFSRTAQVEDVTAYLANDMVHVEELIRQQMIPVLIDPQGLLVDEYRRSVEFKAPLIMVDARMTKKKPELSMQSADMIIGIGPGFIASENCHAVIETNRGHQMGRVIWNGAPEPDTGKPEKVVLHGIDRVLRSPANGILMGFAQIGDHLEQNQLVAEIAGNAVRAPFKGILRGLLHPGTRVWRGLKIGDVDPRDDPRNCYLVSDKALAVGGGVLEAILSKPGFRPFLWK